ncbi:hypothetical protein [Campylobacter rectus]|uniref:hypothetical protein n=1 Tax=Campylobacter rectus TaxID=203 RepID=UPI003C6C9739
MHYRYNIRYDISNERAFNLLKLGNETLMKIEKLFADNNRDILTILRLVYFPKSGKFESNFGYKKTTATRDRRQWAHSRQSLRN